MSNASSPKVNRQSVQKRTIQAEVFRRDDDLWDIEAELLDVKGIEFKLAAGPRAAGLPIHRMRLTVTINNQMDILAAKAESLDVPYPGQCDTIGPQYEQLVGLNLMRGFRSAVKERFAGIKGCTHISELCNILPTAAVQAFAGILYKIADYHTEHETAEKKPQAAQMPFQLNRCHALRTDGEAVKKYHSVWYGAPLEPVEMPKMSSASKKTG